MINKEEKAKIITEFGKNPRNTGAIEVQVAMLTLDIEKLNEHCKVNAHDFSSKRGLLKKVCKRRRFLKYLQTNYASKYVEVIDKLGLRK
jgi:ribosomal protein S15, bacterial/organelle